MSETEWLLLLDGLTWVYTPLLVWLAGLQMAAVFFGSFWAHLSGMIRYASRRD